MLHVWTVKNMLHVWTQSTVNQLQCRPGKRIVGGWELVSEQSPSKNAWDQQGFPRNIFWIKEFTCWSLPVLVHVLIKKWMIWKGMNFWMLLCNVSSVVFFFGGGGYCSPLNVCPQKSFKGFNHHHGIANYINLNQHNRKKQQALLGMVNQGGVIFLRYARWSCFFWRC